MPSQSKLPLADELLYERHLAGIPYMLKDEAHKHMRERWRRTAEEIIRICDYYDSGRVVTKESYYGLEGG